MRTYGAITALLSIVFVFASQAAELRIRVNGDSMKPVLRDGEIATFAMNGTKTASRGAIALIRVKSRDRLLIKRIIALPNDRVHVRRILNFEMIWINHWPVFKLFESGSFKRLQVSLRLNRNKVPKGRYFVLSESLGLDSRQLGWLRGSQILGILK